MIGKVSKLDLNTYSTARGRYTHMAVFINLERALISKILINGNPQRIEYENLPMVCFNCGYYSHTKETCSSVTQISGETEKGESSGHVSANTAAAEEEVNA